MDFTKAVAQNSLTIIPVNDTVLGKIAARINPPAASIVLLALLALRVLWGREVLQVLRDFLVFAVRLAPKARKASAARLAPRGR